MLGNVGEIVQDWLGKYPGGTVVDPVGPPSPTMDLGISGPDKVARGCEFNGYVDRCESGSRSIFQVTHGGSYFYGFRLVRTAQ